MLMPMLLVLFFDLNVEIDSFQGRESHLFGFVYVGGVDEFLGDVIGDDLWMGLL